MEAILESIGYLCQERFREFACTMVTLPVFILYNKSSKKRPRKFNPQGKKMVQRRMFPKENCNDLWPCALLICVANVSEQGEFLLLGHSVKGGITCGRGERLQGHSALMNAQCQVLELSFKPVMGSWVSRNPVSLFPNPEHSV